MTTLNDLQRDAAKAQAALTAEQARQAIATKAAADERHARSIEWAFRCVSDYPQAQAEASAKVTDTLAAFSEAVAMDYGNAPKAYLAFVRMAAKANAVAAEYAKARRILRDAGLIQPENPGHSPDPVGYIHAPFPASAIPTFADMAASTLEAARTAALRLPPPADDPGSFEGQVSDAEREAVFSHEWVLSGELESLLALRTQYPDRFERNVSEADKVQTAAYAAGRLARGYDGKLPKIAPADRVSTPAPHYAPNETARFHLYGQPGPDSSPLEPSRHSRTGI